MFWRHWWRWQKCRTISAVKVHSERWMWKRCNTTGFWCYRWERVLRNKKWNTVLLRHLLGVRWAGLPPPPALLSSTPSLMLVLTWLISTSTPFSKHAILKTTISESRFFQKYTYCDSHHVCANETKLIWILCIQIL